ncbi:MAG: ABC transporter permease, partial [Acidobacteria bacterium]|nr:ABC transporter permease [Acidobacteriota bacterium]
MNTFLRDVTYTLRALLQKPAFTIVAILTLAIAIGATSAMFSVVNAVLLRPLNFNNSENVLIVWESKPSAGFDIFSVSPANFYDWHRLNTVFDSVAAYTRNVFTLTGIDQAERIPSTLVSGDFFKLVRTQPFLGRGLTKDDAQAGKATVIVLSHGLWTRRFASDPQVLGRTVTLDGKQYTIVGVMPQNFMYPSNTELWAPQPIRQTDTRGGHFLTAIARLKPGGTIDAATAEMKTIAFQLETEYPDTNTGWTVRVFNLQEYIVGNIRQALLILLGAVVFVLLIACVNVANLQLARGAERSKEIAVRTALGASRFRLVRQLLTESVLLSATGGALGILIATTLLDAFIGLAPANLPRLNETRIDNSVLAFSIALSLLT